MIPPDGWVTALRVPLIDAELPIPFVMEYRTKGSVVMPVREVEMVALLYSQQARAFEGSSDEGWATAVQLIQTHAFGALLVDSFRDRGPWTECAVGIDPDWDDCQTPSETDWAGCDDGGTPI